MVKAKEAARVAQEEVEDRAAVEHNKEMFQSWIEEAKGRKAEIDVQLAVAKGVAEKRLLEEKIGEEDRQIARHTKSLNRVEEKLVERKVMFAAAVDEAARKKASAILQKRYVDGEAACDDEEDEEEDEVCIYGD